jgi:penicillin amidase
MPAFPSPRRPIAVRLGIYAVSAVLVIALLLALALFLLRHRMATSLAPVDGTLHLPGLSAPVTIRRDRHGVPHIEAANLDDLLMAQGWVTASDRLWQMDMARRLPAGEGAEVLGSPLLPHDRLERTLGMRDVADRMVRTLPPDQLEQLNAYARGVNAYIAHGVLPAEFSLLLYRPKPWEPEDSILVALSMAEMLDTRWEAKLKREQLTARLNAHGMGALAADLYPVGSWRDHPPVPSRPGISDPQDVPQVPLDPSQVRLDNPPLLPAQDLQTLALLAGEAACPGCAPGSNEWAVSGAHTASGKPLLSNDMHLEHQIPDIWYESDLYAGSFHAAGVTVPGLPFISAGHNDHIAWGFTALGGDTQDIYIEQLNPQGEIRTTNAGGQASWQPLTHKKETIRVRFGHDVDIDVERTAHGPVITPLIPGEHRTLALDWAIYHPEAHGLPLYALDSAADWTGFQAALKTWWAPTLNIAYADDAGHIGYQAVGLIPIRSGGLRSRPIPAGLPAPPASAPAVVTDPSLPAIPATPAVVPPLATATPLGEWTGYIPFDALPSVLDPEGGIVATANARVSPDGYPYQLTLDWASPYRNERIWKWLSSHTKLTPADMLTLETDVYSESDQEIAQRLAYAVDHAAKPTKRARAASDLLRSWNGVLAIDSPGASIVTAAEHAFWPAVLGAKIGDGWRLYDWNESDYAREQLITTQPAAWLPPNYRTWNDFLAALVDSVLKDAPSDLRNWHYGDTHTITVRHPLWKLVPGVPSGVGPLPQSGDRSTVKQVSGDLGPSQRFTADISALDASSENILAGQSGDPLSAHFLDQWPVWYRGTTFPLPYTPPAAQAAAQYTLTLIP